MGINAKDIATLLTFVMLDANIIRKRLQLKLNNGSIRKEKTDCLSSLFFC
jgi:hypothetical protein